LPSGLRPKTLKFLWPGQVQLLLLFLLQKKKKIEMEKREQNDKETEDEEVAGGKETKASKCIIIQSHALFFYLNFSLSLEAS
jgi:hypothetical protein